MKEDIILFSIIVPAYQVEKYVEQCIMSLIPQCETNCEIIIIDDGAYDKSREIAEEYAGKYEFISVIHQDNQGLSAARNTGIHHAKGEYCIFVDGDDMLCEGAIDSLRKCIEDKRQPEIIIHRRKQIDSTGKSRECRYWFDEKEMQPLSVSELYERLQKMPELWIGTWIFSVRTDYIRKNKFYFAKGLLHEDEEWVPKILLNAKSIAYNNTCFYCYRIDREGSITKTPNIKREFDKLKIIDLVEQEFDKARYSADINRVIKKRVQSIYFGVICSAWQYRKDVGYITLLKQVKKKQILLQNSSSMKYEAVYLMMTFLGVRETCFYFWYINKAKRMCKFLHNKINKAY